MKLAEETKDQNDSKPQETENKNNSTVNDEDDNPTWDKVDKE